jgi:hypothetical protein
MSCYFGLVGVEVQHSFSSSILFYPISRTTARSILASIIPPRNLIHTIFSKHPLTRHVPHHTSSSHSHRVPTLKNVITCSFAIDRAALLTTESMSDREPRLDDLYRATLQTPTRREPHVDSEEAVQYERQRVSRELEPIRRRDFVEQSSEARRSSRIDTSSRPRNASPRISSASRDHLRHRASNASVQADVPGASVMGARSTRSSVKEPHWYDPVAKFWRTHISLTIGEGAHRDHLGMSIPQDCNCTQTDTPPSTRAHLLRLSPHFPHPRHDRRPDRATLPPATRRQPEPRLWLLRHWPAAEHCVHWHGDIGGASWRV